jgi:hypothetical protein
MKKHQKPKRLILLSFFAGIIYLLMIAGYFVSEWDDFQLGYWEGWNSEGTLNTDNRSLCSPGKAYFLYVLPKKGISSFPDKITNLMSNQSIDIRHSEFKAFVPKSATEGKTIILYDLSIGICAFMMLIICFIIPFQFYMFISSIIKEVIFDKDNIGRIRKIGISLIFFYSFYFIFNFLNYLKNCKLFEFSDYSLKMDSVDAIWLLLGIVVLLIAEIILRGKALKEEQELTI